jgi:hypothetical protein
VIFGTGHGTDLSELAAYPAGCGHDCSPEWTVDTGQYVGETPILAGDVVVTSASGSVAAFPVQCGSPCAVAWTWEWSGYAALEYGDEETVIVLSRGDPVAVYALPADCPVECQPLWERRYDEDPMPRGTAVDGRNLFIAFPGRVIAHRLATGHRVWRGSTHTGEGWWLDPRGRSLVVSLRRSNGGMLDTFTAAS